MSKLEQAIAFIQGLPDAPFAIAELPPGLDMRDVIEATRLLAGEKPRPPGATLEAACRAWWDADSPANLPGIHSWDEFVAKAREKDAPPLYQQSVDSHRRRMTAALVAAIGWP